MESVGGMDTALVSRLRRNPAAARAARPGRLAIVALVAVAAVSGGVVLWRGTPTGGKLAMVSRSQPADGSAPSGSVLLHLLPPDPVKADPTAQTRPAADPDRHAGPPSPAIPSPATPNLPTPPGPASPAAAAGTEMATAAPQTQDLAGDAQSGAPSDAPRPQPDAILDSATASVPAVADDAPPANFVPAIPKLALRAKSMPLGAVLLVSGLLNSAPPQNTEAPEVQVTEAEAPVAPQKRADKPAPKKGESAAKRARAVDIEPLPPGPLIPPASIEGGPPPSRAPLLLDTDLAPLGPAPAPGKAHGPAAAASPAAEAASDPAASMLAAHAATLPSPAPTGPDDLASVRVVFGADETDLPQGSDQELRGIVRLASADEHRRVRLVAYAGGDEDGGNQARRMSLSRALAVRTFLIQQGMPSGRLEVRALGNRSEGGPRDRVDLFVSER